MNLAVFDGDDTLWVLEALYDAAREAAKRVVADAGLDSVRWEELQRSIDVGLVQDMGFAAKRFPTSNVKAYEELTRREGVSLDVGVREQVEIAAESVFWTPAPLTPGAREVLQDLGSDFRLALLTRGEEWVQRRRIETSGLGHLFEDIQVVPEKTPAIFQQIAKRFGASRAGNWSIGNSLPSDIYPALQAGFGGVWIETHVWEYERRTTPSVEGHIVKARTLSEVPQLLRTMREVV